MSAVRTGVSAYMDFTPLISVVTSLYMISRANVEALISCYYIIGLYNPYDLFF